ncbi:MAG: DUF4013 domain-containing protein [Candidatus Bathyarchaeota archaeon]|nr:DUF4013 domain-containing protein [Candidatus Bathyarchaeota archaeon]
MLTSEFKNAYQYTLGVIEKNQYILIIACLIPFLNILVLIRYVDKIVKQPTNSTKPPRLTKPNWAELVMSLLKIAAVGALWGVIAVALMAVVGLGFGVGIFGGFGSILRLAEEFSANVLGAALASMAVFFVVGIFAVISEVNMIKRQNLMAGFAFKDLLGSISRIGWVRYLLFIFASLVSWLIVIFVSSQLGNFLHIGLFAVSLMGIFALLPITFLARAISVLYDNYQFPPPPPPP